MRGYTASRFSFNTEGGRCETCTGQGVIKVEMNFLPTQLSCRARIATGSATTRRHWRCSTTNSSIGDVMEMTLEQAAEFFPRAIRRSLVRSRCSAIPDLAI